MRKVNSMKQDKKHTPQLKDTIFEIKDSVYELSRSSLQNNMG